jgi:hypothetical protein
MPAAAAVMMAAAGGGAKGAEVTIAWGLRRATLRITTEGGGEGGTAGGRGEVTGGIWTMAAGGAVARMTCMVQEGEAGESEEAGGEVGVAMIYMQVCIRVRLKVPMILTLMLTPRPGTTEEAASAAAAAVAAAVVRGLMTRMPTSTPMSTGRVEGGVRAGVRGEDDLAGAGAGAETGTGVGVGTAAASARWALLEGLRLAGHGAPRMVAGPVDPPQETKVPRMVAKGGGGAETGVG